jgi:hypothetical protein
MNFPGEGRTIKIESGPEYVYMHFSDAYVSLVFTVPDAKTSLPENATLSPSSDKNGINVKLKNNNAWVRDGASQNLIMENDNNKPEIQSVVWQGKEYSLMEIIEKQAELLEQYYVSRLGGNKEAVERIRQSTGLKKGDYLFRAVTSDELWKLKRNKSQYYTQNDPSANFENEKMYKGEDSQVRSFSGNTKEGYSGHIIRWRVEDPILYRYAGMKPPRIVPMFSHFIPDNLEISEDGINFKPFSDFLKQEKPKTP